MLDFYSYEGLRNGATFIVDSATKTALEKSGYNDIVGRAVAITGNGQVGYGKDGDIPIGFVEQIESEYSGSDSLVVSVIWNMCREYVPVASAAAGDVLVCDGKGGLKKAESGASTAIVFSADGGYAAVYMGGIRSTGKAPDDGKPKISRYGFAHSAAEANSALSVKDAATDTFWVVFDTPVGENKYVIDVEIDGHKFTNEAAEIQPTWTKLYWKLGTSNTDTMFDKVDGKSASEFKDTWPTITGEATTATLSVKYKDGGSVKGADKKTFGNKEMSLDDTNKVDVTIE